MTALRKQIVPAKSKAMSEDHEKGCEMAGLRWGRQEWTIFGFGGRTGPQLLGASVEALQRQLLSHI